MLELLPVGKGDLAKYLQNQTLTKASKIYWIAFSWNSLMHTKISLFFLQLPYFTSFVGDAPL
jgi:hypothetical protein